MRKLITNKMALLLFDLFKGRNTNKYLQFYRRTLKWSQEEIRNYQLKQLLKLINHAYNNVPFYKNRFNKKKITPKDINRLEDLKKIPVLSRADLQKHSEKLFALNFNKQKCSKGSSSGSTGEPVIYYHDRIGSSAGQAASLLGWSFSGWKFGLKGLHIWGNPRVVNVEWKKLSSRIKAYLFNHYKFPAYKLTNENKFNELLNIIQEKKYNFIDGYTNAIYLFADFVKKKKISINHFSYIFTTGENLQNYQRDLIEEVLGKVYDMYGCSEINGVANQCKICGKYHVIDPHVIVEYDQLSKQNDGSCELIITDLNNYSFPFIRYKNGDVAIPIKEDVVDCRIKFSRIESISGRVSDIVELPRGGVLSVPSFFGSMLLKQVKGIKHYQIEKVSKNKLIIKIVVEKKFSDNDLDKISESLEEYLKGRIDWEVKIVEKIELNKTGKFKLLIDKTADK